MENQIQCGTNKSRFLLLCVSCRPALFPGDSILMGLIERITRRPVTLQLRRT
jgi:hypothetical protein